jgi:mRNA-degrading endonuclease YafQ of YafQ-DinJ toxin-antitoxin module
MKQQIKDVEELQKKIDAFDASKCKELMELLENKKKANEIVKEFQTA